MQKSCFNNFLWLERLVYDAFLSVFRGHTIFGCVLLFLLHAMSSFVRLVDMCYFVGDHSAAAPRYT